MKFEASAFAFVSECSSWILLGVLTIQLCHCLQSYPKDPLWMKVVILIIWVVEAARATILGYSLWAGFVLNFGVLVTGRPARKILWTIPSSGILGSFATLLTQSLYIRRLWLLDRKHWTLPLVTEAIAIVAFGSSCHTSVAFVKGGDGLTGQYYDRYAGLWLTATLVTDLLVTIPTAWRLYRASAVFKDTRSLINHLVIWVVATGALTASLTLAALVLFFTNNRGFTFDGLLILSQTIFPNCLLAFLNQRGRWHKQSTPRDVSRNGLATSKSPWSDHAYPSPHRDAKFLSSSPDIPGRRQTHTAGTIT